MSTDIRTVGDDLIEVDVPDSRAARAIGTALRETGHFAEVVPALRVVTAQYDPLGMTQADLKKAVESAVKAASSSAEEPQKTLTIPVRYGGEDGPDLAAVADSAGLTPEVFIRLHTSTDYPVEMIGFTPGFAYLGGLDGRVAIGRLESPRARVPAGSVGVIKGYSGVYPLAGPGGWPIVGRTDLSLFDREAEDPFRLRPGMTVRFEAAS